MTKTKFMAALATVAALTTVSQEALAETPTYKMEPGAGGRACQVSFTGLPQSLTIGLDGGPDDWKILLFVSANEDGFRRYYTGGLVDADLFKDETSTVTLDGTSFRAKPGLLTDLRASELSTKTTAIVAIPSSQQAAAFVQALPFQVAMIGKSARISGHSDGLEKFKRCALAEMGLDEGEQLAPDHRAEFRLIFEDAWAAWARSVAQADSCHGSDSKAEVIAAIDDSADAFFPGLFQFSPRGAWRERMTQQIDVIWLQGSVDAVTNGCTGAALQAELGHNTVKAAAQAARDID